MSQNPSGTQGPSSSRKPDSKKPPETSPSQAKPPQNEESKKQVSPQNKGQSSQRELQRQMSSPKQSPQPNFGDAFDALAGDPEPSQSYQKQNEQDKAKLKSQISSKRENKVDPSIKDQLKLNLDFSKQPEAKPQEPPQQVQSKRSQSPDNQTQLQQVQPNITNAKLGPLNQDLEQQISSIRGQPEPAPMDVNQMKDLLMKGMAKNIKDRKSQKQQQSIERQSANQLRNDFHLALAKLYDRGTENQGIQQCHRLIESNFDSPSSLHIFLEALYNRSAFPNESAQKQIKGPLLHVSLYGFLAQCYKQNLIDPVEKPPSLFKTATRIQESIYTFFKEGEPQIWHQCGLTLFKLLEECFPDRSVSLAAFGGASVSHMFFWPLLKMLAGGANKMQQDGACHCIRVLLESCVEKGFGDMVEDLGQMVMRQPQRFKTENHEYVRTIVMLIENMKTPPITSYTNDLINFGIRVISKPSSNKDQKVAGCNLLETLAKRFTSVADVIIPQYKNEVFTALNCLNQDKLTSVIEARNAAHKAWLDLDNVYQEMDPSQKVDLSQLKPSTPTKEAQNQNLKLSVMRNVSKQNKELKQRMQSADPSRKNVEFSDSNIAEKMLAQNFLKKGRGQGGGASTSPQQYKEKKLLDDLKIISQLNDASRSPDRQGIQEQDVRGNFLKALGLKERPQAQQINKDEENKAEMIGQSKQFERKTASPQKQDIQEEVFYDSLQKSQQQRLQQKLQQQPNQDINTQQPGTYSYQNQPRTKMQPQYSKDGQSYQKNLARPDPLQRSSQEKNIYEQQAIYPKGIKLQEGLQHPSYQTPQYQQNPNLVSSPNKMIGEEAARSQQVTIQPPIEMFQSQSFNEEDLMQPTNSQPMIDQNQFGRQDQQRSPEKGSNNLTMQVPTNMSKEQIKQQLQSQYPGSSVIEQPSGNFTISYPPQAEYFPTQQQNQMGPNQFQTDQTPQGYPQTQALEENQFRQIYQQNSPPGNLSPIRPNESQQYQQIFSQSAKHDQMFNEQTYQQEPVQYQRHGTEGAQRQGAQFQDMSPNSKINYIKEQKQRLRTQQNEMLRENPQLKKYYDDQFRIQMQQMEVQNSNSKNQNVVEGEGSSVENIEQRCAPMNQFVEERNQNIPTVVPQDNVASPMTFYSQNSQKFEVPIKANFPIQASKLYTYQQPQFEEPRLENSQNYQSQPYPFPQQEEEEFFGQEADEDEVSFPPQANANLDYYSLGVPQNQAKHQEDLPSQSTKQFNQHPEAVGLAQRQMSNPSFGDTNGQYEQQLAFNIINAHGAQPEYRSTGQSVPSYSMQRQQIVSPAMDAFPQKQSQGLKPISQIQPIQTSHTPTTYQYQSSYTATHQSQPLNLHPQTREVRERSVSNERKRSNSNQRRESESYKEASQSFRPVRISGQEGLTQVRSDPEMRIDLSPREQQEKQQVAKEYQPFYNQHQQTYGIKRDDSDIDRSDLESNTLEEEFNQRDGQTISIPESQLGGARRSMVRSPQNFKEFDNIHPLQDFRQLQVEFQPQMVEAKTEEIRINDPWLHPGFRETYKIGEDGRQKEVSLNVEMQGSQKRGIPRNLEPIYKNQNLNQNMKQNAHINNQKQQLPQAAPQSSLAPQPPPRMSSQQQQVAQMISQQIMLMQKQMEKGFSMMTGKIDAIEGRVDAAAAQLDQYERARGDDQRQIRQWEKENQRRLRGFQDSLNQQQMMLKEQVIKTEQLYSKQSQSQVPQVYPEPLGCNPHFTQPAPEFQGRTYHSGQQRQKSPSRQGKLTAAWTKAMELVKKRQYEEAYRLVMKEGDDIYLLRLVAHTGPVIKFLDDETSISVITRINKIVRSGAFHLMEIEWLEDANRRGLFGSLTKYEQNEYLDTLYNLSKCKMNLKVSEKASGVYSQIRNSNMGPNQEKK